MNKKRVLSLLAVVIIAMSLVSVAFATETGTDATQAQPWWAGIVPMLPIVIIFAVFYFVLIRPENKRKKETASMRENLAVGDEITTIGGIIGEILNIGSIIIALIRFSKKK